jgi:arginyl-tRNA synthetase
MVEIHGSKEIHPIRLLRHSLAKEIAALFGIPVEVDAIVLETPPSHIQADFSFSTFAFAGLMRQSPQVIAETVAGHIGSTRVLYVQHVFHVGPYVNIVLDQHDFSVGAITHILSSGASVGHREDVPANQKRKVQFQSIWFNSEALPSVDTLRVNTKKKALQKVFSVRGIDTKHNTCSLGDSDSYTPDDLEKIVVDVTQCLQTRSIEGSNAVWVDGDAQVPPAVFRRHDGTYTPVTKCLGALKSIFQDFSCSEVLLFSDESRMLDEIFAIARVLGYVPEGVVVHSVHVGKYVGGDTPTDTLNVRFGLMRISTKKKVSTTDIKEHQYLYVQDVLNRLSAGAMSVAFVGDKEPVSLVHHADLHIHITKELMNYSQALDRVVDEMDMSSFIIYLEQIAQLCDQSSVYEDGYLCAASALVLQHGISFLTE